MLNQCVVISAANDVLANGVSVDETLRTVADPTRAAIIEVLAAGPACNCHLVADLQLTQPNVSNHLRALRHAGLVTTEQHGRFTFYRLVPEALEAAAAHLAEVADRARATAGLRREC